MKAGLILDAIKTQLQNSADLSYVDDTAIFLGVRENLTKFPLILVEPTQISEGDFSYPKQRLHFSLVIVGYIKVMDMDKQFQGDVNIKGILDLENDIKLALDSDRTLAGTAIHLDIKNTSYDFVDFPVRSVNITVDVLFEQVKGTR